MEKKQRIDLTRTMYNGGIFGRIPQDMLYSIFRILGMCDFLQFTSSIKFLREKADDWTQPGTDFSSDVCDDFYNQGRHHLKKLANSSVMVSNAVGRLLFSYHMADSTFYEDVNVTCYAIRLAIHHQDPTILYRHSKVGSVFDQGSDYLLQLLGCMRRPNHYDLDYLLPKEAPTRSLVSHAIVSSAISQILEQERVLSAEYFIAIFLGSPDVADARLALLLQTYDRYIERGWQLYDQPWQSFKLRNGRKLPRIINFELDLYADSLPNKQEIGLFAVHICRRSPCQNLELFLDVILTPSNSRILATELEKELFGTRAYGRIQNPRGDDDKWIQPYIAPRFNYDATKLHELRTIYCQILTQTSPLTLLHVCQGLNCWIRSKSDPICPCELEYAEWRKKS